MDEITKSEMIDSFPDVLDNIQDDIKRIIESGSHYEIHLTELLESVEEMAEVTKKVLSK